MTPDEQSLDSFLDSLAGGETVDWSRAEERVGGDDRLRLRALRDVAKVADFHRTLQRDLAGGTIGRDVARWNDLLVLERVGSGANGDVYRAWDPALQREVALKVLRPRDGVAAGELLEEARALARVRDPHVVVLHGAAEHEGRVGLWMEFLRGPTLEAEIARRGALPAEDVARLGMQLAGALAAVHAALALHRDVKPANVILEHDGRAVLMDFGLGHRRLGGGAASSTFSGTPMFMSPARLAGEPATPADDVYALGATLWCALAGAPPFQARSLDELRRSAAAGPARSLLTLRPDAAAPLVASIERAMAPASEGGIVTAAALASALESAAPSLAAGGHVDGPESAGRAVSPRRGPASAAWIAGVAALVAAVVTTVMVRPHRETAVAPPATSPPAAEVAAPYDVSATFLRRGRDADTRLESGDRVAPGDRLSLEFHATRPVWVYVLDADDRGETYLLFPQPLFDRGNPMPRDSTIVLPGALRGHENAWTVTSRGGRERLMVVASPDRIPDLEAELARLPAPVPGRPVRYARVETGTMDRLRGVGGVAPLPQASRAPGSSAVFDRIQALAGRERSVQGTWVRQIVLENPLR